MRTSNSLRWLTVAVSAVLLLAVAAACGETQTIEVPGETIVTEVVKTVEVPGETVVKEVVKTVEVPGQTVIKEVVKEVEVPGQTVIVEKEVIREVEVPVKPSWSRRRSSSLSRRPPLPSSPRRWRRIR